MPVPPLGAVQLPAPSSSVAVPPRAVAPKARTLTLPVSTTVTTPAESEKQGAMTRTVMLPLALQCEETRIPSPGIRY